MMGWFEARRGEGSESEVEWRVPQGANPKVPTPSLDYWLSY